MELIGIILWFMMVWAFSEDCVTVGPTWTHCMTRSTLTLLKEDSCNIEMVVFESNLQRSVTLLQEHQETTERGSGGTVHL